MKVVDAFMYSGDYEDSLLKLRLNTLNPLIDKFIIMESRYTHSGTLKSLGFNIDKFPEFKNKIIYFTKDTNISDNPHLNEQAARNSLITEIDKIVGPNDIILHSDLDEIPESEVLADLVYIGVNRPYTLTGKYFLFCMDLYGRLSLDGVLITRKMLDNYTLQDFRSHRTNWQYKNVFTHVPDSSYHYSSCFSLKGIAIKMRSFCHANEMDPSTINEDYIKQCIKLKKNWDKNGKIGEMKSIEMKYPNCPKYVEQNISQYKQFLSSNYE